MAETAGSVGLTIERVNKWYPGGVHAVRDVDLTVENGEFMIFVGPSGCGKSTLLRMIAGLETVNSGTIRMDGRVINRVPPRARDIAMVFQNYALYPTMKVRDNMAFPLKMRRWSREAVRSRVEEVAESLGLTEYLDRRPGALSGGQRQRVALGRAMVRQPKLFLMDEPLSNLDAKLRVDMRREIVALQRRLGTTTIYVTHDQTEAMTMGTRIAVLRDGVLQQVDTPRALYDAPANLFVAQFIGSPPMNLWDGRAFWQEGCTWLELSGQAFSLGQGIRLPQGAFGRDLAVGVRPEHVCPARPDDPVAFPACITAVENTGRECLVFLESQSGETFTMAAGADFPGRPGEGMEVSLRLDRLHLFDRETGERIEGI